MDMTRLVAVLLAAAFAAVVHAGVAYVNMSKYVVEAKTPCGPSYVFTAPLDTYVTLGRWLEEQKIVEKYDTPLRKKAREMLGIKSEDNVTVEQWNALVSLTQSLLRDKVEAVERVLRDAGVEVVGVSGSSALKLRSDRSVNGTVYAFVRLGGRPDVLKKLEEVAAAYNISVVVVDLPRVNATDNTNKTVDFIPGLGAPKFRDFGISIFGPFSDAAFYVGKADEKLAKAVAKYLEEKELCGVAVYIVPSDDYVPHIVTLEGKAGPEPLLYGAVAAGLAALALALLVAVRRK